MALRRFMPALLAVALGCTAAEQARIPEVQAPQLEGLRRELEVDPAKRLRAYDACKAASPNNDGLIACMEQAGFRFIPQTVEPRAQDCWQRRTSPHLVPLAYCFEPIARTAP